MPKAESRQQKNDVTLSHGRYEVSALSGYPLLRMDQVNQVTHIFHTQDFTQFKFDPEGLFHLADQLDMAQRIPLFYIMSGRFPSNSDVVFLENFLEHSL